MYHGIMSLISINFMRVRPWEALGKVCFWCLTCFCIFFETVVCIVFVWRFHFAFWIWKIFENYLIKNWKIFENNLKKFENNLKNIWKIFAKRVKTIGKLEKHIFFHIFCKYFTFFIFLQKFCKFAISGYNLWESWKIANNPGKFAKILKNIWKFFEKKLKNIWK